jgi:hypothetical protein
MGLQTNPMQNKKFNKNSFFIKKFKGFGAAKRLSSFARKRRDLQKNRKERNQLINWFLRQKSLN